MKMTTLEQFKAEAFKNKELKRAYDELDVEFQLVRTIMKKRINEGLTQAELAKQVGTKQSAIARFEAGKSNPTLDFIQRLSRALDMRLSIK